MPNASLLFNYWTKETYPTLFRHHQPTKRRAQEDILDSAAKIPITY